MQSAIMYTFRLYHVQYTFTAKIYCILIIFNMKYYIKYITYEKVFDNDV
jgi:hypothetical protein